MRKNLSLVALFFLCITSQVFGQTFVTVDPFETHNWHAIGFSDDTGSGEYSSDWKTQGETSYKMTVTRQGSGFFIFGTGVFDTESPKSIKFDVKAENDIRLEIKVVDSNNNESQLGFVDINAGEEKLDNVLSFNGKSMRKMYLVPSNYGDGTHTVYIDNMRISVNENEFVWDGFEEHFYWDGSADADNPDFLTDRADDITRSLFSPNFNSTASLIMEWDAQIDTNADFAQIQIQNVNIDYSDYYYFRFDAYRPNTTPNVNLFVFLFDGTKGAGTNFIKLDTPDQWTTVTLLLGETLNLENLTEVKFVVPFTDSSQYATGRLYFDNLQVGGFTPKETPVDLKTIGFPHVLKDFSDGLDGNKFFGISNLGAGNGATISRQLSKDVFNTSPAMQLDYNVDPDDSFIFYFNTLAMNSIKDKLALYLRGGDSNPHRVKLEFHDNNWLKSGFREGNAFSILSGISSTEWKQWIVPTHPESLTVVGSFDPTDIREVVLSLDHRTADDQAKSGFFYVDDIIFVDQTDDLVPFPGLCFPLTEPKDVQTLGVPYLLDDFDGRVLAADTVRNQGFNEFFGLASVGFDTKRWDDLAFGSISSTENGGIAHTAPYSYRIDYSFDPDSVDQFAFYFNTLAPHGSQNSIRDFSFLEQFSIWLRGGNEGNPEAVVLEFHDDRWQSSNFTTGKAHCVLQGIEASQWQQWLVPLDKESLLITGEIDFSRITEIVLSFDVSRVKDKSGTFYVDDMHFIDIDEKYIGESDFNKEEFLELVSRRTFQYFLDAIDPKTGLVLDRVHFLDLATIAGTGFGLTAICVGAYRDWIDSSEAESYVIQVFENLLKTPQGPQISGTSGYKGFFYHFLDSTTALRKITPGRTPVELSIIDTALLMAGVLTAREYFSSNTAIVDSADVLYNRIDWSWFLDTTGNPDTNEHYNQFYLGWSPENKFSGHWDFTTDEVILINLLAIGSPTHPVATDVFYAWERELGTYNGHTLFQSFFGAMFQYFFANCWYDLHGKQDSLGVNWWLNSVKAGLANRDFCIAGMDGNGRQNVPTYHENSWGLSSVEAIPAGIDTFYHGDNGALPNGFFDRNGLSEQINGTVPVYGGLSMIGFSRHPEGIPIEYITNMMQHYYQKTQLWTGWYGFRDAYTDSVNIKHYEELKPKRWAISKFPIYKSSYFAIDQGPILIMIENYRSGLIWNTFMRNATVQSAMAKIFQDIPSSVTSDLDDKPRSFTLKQNYPNPFNPETTIQYEIPKASQVSIRIFNLLGEEVKKLLNAEKKAGKYTISWNGKNNLGQQVSSGLYLYRIEAGDFIQIRKMILLR